MWSATLHGDGDVHVIAGGVGIGADFLVGFLDEGFEFGLGQAVIDNVHCDSKAKAAAVARTNGDGAGDRGVLGVLFMLGGDEVECAAKAGSVTAREQVLGRGGVRFAWAAHFLWHGQVDGYGVIGGLGVAVAATGGGCGCSEKRFDLHGCSS